MNVPKLRFSEFNDEYNNSKLNDYLELLTDYDANGSFADMANNVVTYDTSNFAWYVRATDLENGVDLAKVKYTDEKSYNFLKKTKLYGNEVLMAKRGNIGNVYYFEAKTEYATLGPNCYLLKTNDKVNNLYLYNYLKSDLGQNKLKRLNASSTLGALYKDDVKNIKLYFPSIKEQEKIGKMLSLLDKKIELQSKKIEDLKLYKISNLRNVFSICDIRIKLKEICIIEKGKQINSDELTNDGKYYMLNGGISPSGYLNEYNTDENTITISEGGNSCGYINYNNEKFWCGGHCYKIIKPKINNKYLYQLLKYNESKIMDLRVGSGLPNIQKKDLENYNVNIHQKEKQNEISNFLDKIDQKLQLEILKLSKLQELKKGLMQSMFV